MAAVEPDAPARLPLRAAWREPRTLLVGLLVLCFAFTEGTANDWLAVALVDGHGTSEAVGALGFACFVVAMTASRTVGGPLLERYGRPVVLRATAAVALVGLLLVVLARPLPLVLAGALLWGAGAALGFPVGMCAAADDPHGAAVRVSVVSSVGYTAFLAGPPLVGLLAEPVAPRGAARAAGRPGGARCRRRRGRARRPARAGARAGPLVELAQQRRRGPCAPRLDDELLQRCLVQPVQLGQHDRVAVEVRRREAPRLRGDERLLDALVDDPRAEDRAVGRGVPEVRQVGPAQRPLPHEQPVAHAPLQRPARGALARTRQREGEPADVLQVATGRPYAAGRQTGAMTSAAARPTDLDPSIAGKLKRDRDGLVVAVAQQHDTGEVLMVGWMDDEALHRTLTTGRCTYWSRSRQEYWVKGDTSGSQQWVKSVSLDCDGDTLLVRVDQVGSGACHTGDRTCFDAVQLDAVVGSP